MPDTREPSGGLLGLAAVGMVAACCALPGLLAGGILLSAAGVVVGSIVLTALGAGLALWGWRRRSMRRCETPAPPAQPGASNLEPHRSHQAPTTTSRKNN